MNYQKIGGIAAITEAIIYLIGFIFLFLFLAPSADTLLSDTEKLAFVLEKKSMFQIWNILIYVLFGLVLILLTIALQENFQNKKAIGLKTIPVLGFIWSGLVISSGMIANIGLETLNDLYTEDPATAVVSWKILSTIQNGLGGGVEVVGGLWVFLISVYGLKEKVFPKTLNYLGVLVGGTGMLTLVPGLQELGALFGLTQIIWFLWIGIHMLTHKKPSVINV